jgi:sorbitol/mannitol transport system substrate-binding protein
VLRQRVTTDITTNGGQFDIMTIGMYETPIWGANGWLVPLDDLSEEYDVDDILPAMRAGLSHDGTLYAAPFYGESSMVMYRTDLMEAAGLEMPDAPTWQFIREAAAAMDDPENDINGICLRGKAGWGEGGAFITVTGNSFGARWFDEDWNAQFDQPEWKEALNFFVSLMNDYGPDRLRHQRLQREPVAVPAGQVRHVDRRHRCGVLRDQPRRLHRCRQVGFALAPNSEPSTSGPTGSGPGRWRSPPARSRKTRRKQFIEWATSKDYIELVAENEGWANVPPGARTSLYENPELQEVPFAQMTLDSINAADPNNPTVDPVPYVGIQFVAIPEFAGIATEVSQEFSAVYAGQQTVEEALAKAQALTNDAMEAAGYR